MMDGSVSSFGICFAFVSNRNSANTIALCAATYMHVFMYIDSHACSQEVEQLEKNFPMYSEATECKGSKAVWGDIKLGRIPEFLYADASLDTSRVAHCAEDDALAEAKAYRIRFEHAFQFLQERCQHHIHRLVNGKRSIPNACRSK